MQKVSVVIPVYNVESYLRECLNSIVSQTLKNIEIICVNDGSTDQSYSILQEYSRKDSRIKIIKQENRGLSGARNTGAKAISGEYIYFMDSDDFLDHDALELLYDQAHRDCLDILYFDATVFFEDEDIESKFSDYKSYYVRNGRYSTIETGIKLLSEMVSNRDWKPSAVLQLINSEFYKSLNLSFYEGILHEDNLFSFEAALQAKRVAHKPVPYFHRRVRHASLVTMEKTSAHFNGYFICYIEMMRFCQSHQIYDPDSNKAIAELMIGIFNGAIKVYSALSSKERSELKPYESAPDIIAAFETITRQAKYTMELTVLKNKHQKCDSKLNEVSSSRAYKLARALSRIYRFGK